MTKVLHLVEHTEVGKNIENPCFILTNKLGGYASFSNYPMTRYQGAFFNDGIMYKVIESIIPLGAGSITEVRNRLWCVERNRLEGKNVTRETFFMPIRHNCLVYELSDEKDIQLDLDVKEPYDNREFGRYYKVSESKDKVIIEFTKKTDRKEDRTDGQQEYKVYVVIGGMMDMKSLKKPAEFYPVQYPLDRTRGSRPFERYVYKAIVINARNLVITFSKDKKEAIDENNHVIKHLHSLKEKQAIYINGFQKRMKDENVNIGYKAACVSLDHLLNNMPKNQRGIYAGLWWFFQYWARDELVSLKAFMLQKKYDVVKEVLFKYLKLIGEDGRLPNRYPQSNLGSADAIGWLFKRLYDFFEELYRKQLLKDYLSDKEILFMKTQVENSIFNLLKRHTSEDYAVNGRLETWMDTSYGSDARDGMRIEIQALRLCMYKLMKLLCKTVKDDIGYNMAVHLENDLAEKVRKNFWNGDYLKDGLNDDTIRPNIFIAYYVYPELLKSSQWASCFKAVLKKTWCEWGGIATIDRDNHLFTPSYTGEDNRSYHRGDSWYWLNNLAALCMLRVSKMKFGSYAEKICKASTDEILWSGAIGHHAELSSASAPESQGCVMQAWSAAMYIEMINEMF